MQNLEIQPMFLEDAWDSVGFIESPGLVFFSQGPRHFRWLQAQVQALHGRKCIPAALSEFKFEFTLL